MESSKTRITKFHGKNEFPGNGTALVSRPQASHGIPAILETRGRILKRFSDIVFSSLIIVCFHSWMIPILALCIKLNSKGPVFFIQWRTGRNNRPFRCIKLRTMVSNDGHERQAHRNDPRITAVGKFLRKFSLDELPQFFNVLAGHMSIVGPRPHMIRHTSDFEARVSGYQQRLLVRPGITGLSQIQGYRGEIKEPRGLINRVRLDIFYIKKWNLSLDLKIMLQTIKLVILGDEQAY